ncbi:MULTISPECIES: hypothetical protein [Leptolyngbya]|nr:MULTISPECIES: hypothetical protein [Leptolyngbya]MBD2403808.1 hypothetical protein [Leptolyngbya sp. FACHB-402]ULP33464.1 hypothetical protein MCP04_30510 [Leptolyngbya boryana IU 594]
MCKQLLKILRRMIIGFDSTVRPVASLPVSLRFVEPPCLLAREEQITATLKTVLGNGQIAIWEGEPEEFARIAQGLGLQSQWQENSWGGWDFTAHNDLGETAQITIVRPDFAT